MPIDNKVFDETPESIPFKLMELFIKHPHETFSHTELKKQFGEYVLNQLLFLMLDSKITHLTKNGEDYFRLKK